MGAESACAFTFLPFHFGGKFVIINAKEDQFIFSVLESGCNPPEEVNRGAVDQAFGLETMAAKPGTAFEFLPGFPSGAMQEHVSFFFLRE